jgi:hypothetical protein
VKDQGHPLRLIDFTVVFDTDDLSGSEKNKCSFLIIVIVTTVPKVSAFYFFQKYRVKAERMETVP